MKVLQVNNTDLIGRRFNGFDLIEPLGSVGIECSMAVLDKCSDEQAVVGLAHGQLDSVLRSEVQELESHYCMNGILYPWGETLARTEAFRSADVVHYHLIHNQLISLLDLPRLMSEKPSVWTFHDSWPLTAHCIQPCGCEGWRSRCQACGRPDLPFELTTECSGMMWKVKDDIYSQLDVDIVVATKDLHDRVLSSPLGQHFARVHTIPFGVKDPQVPDKQSCRAALGIPAEAFVLLFRASTAEVKGLNYLIDALRIAPPARCTSLLAVEQPGLLAELGDHYDIHEFGWAGDSLDMQLLGACDVVVTPYPWAVGMGLMAVEAMAAARVVVCFEGTSIESVTHAPNCGVAVRNRDAVALREALDRLMENSGECMARGRAGQDIAHNEYGEGPYVQSMIRLYNAVCERAAQSRTSWGSGSVD